MRDFAIEGYHNELVCWATLAPWSERGGRPPELPDILRGSDADA